MSDRPVTDMKKALEIAASLRAAEQVTNAAKPKTKKELEAELPGLEVDAARWRRYLEDCVLAHTHIQVGVPAGSTTKATDKAKPYFAAKLAAVYERILAIEQAIDKLEEEKE